jgi:hypothetical protein
LGETGTFKLFTKVKDSRDAMITHLRNDANAVRREVEGGHV